MWWLLLACGEPEVASSSLETELAEAQERIEALEAELAERGERVAAMENLDRILDNSYRSIEARCQPETEGYSLGAEEVEVLLSAPEQIVQMGHWIPHRDREGNRSGWRLVRTRLADLHTSCGFRAADVVQAINEISVETSMPWEEIEAGLQERGEAIFSLERMGKPTLLRIAIR